MPSRFGIDLDLEKSWDEGIKGIRNCSFKFVCDKKWGDLRKIEGQQDVRFCGYCLKEVHYIDDAWGLVLALDNDWCVAVTRTLAITAKGIKNLSEPLMGSVVSAKHGKSND